jgi:hypothetical protein
MSKCCYSGNICSPIVLPSSDGTYDFWIVTG